jgi:hypothetical protein
VPNTTAVIRHLVGSREQPRRHREAERLRRLEVDGELILARRLHREIGWLLAPQDAIDIAGRLPILLDHVRPVGGQLRQRPNLRAADREDHIWIEGEQACRAMGS